MIATLESPEPNNMLTDLFFEILFSSGMILLKEKCNALDIITSIYM